MKKINKAKAAKQVRKGASKSRKKPSAFSGRVKIKTISYREIPVYGTMRWVARNSENTIISEAPTRDGAIKIAKTIAAKFSLAYIPKEGAEHGLDYVVVQYVKGKYQA